MPYPILLVEDDADIRYLCSNYLKRNGYAVDTASNGQEALDYLTLHDKTPCLILLDILMPIMNGKEFMLEFAKRPHTLVPIPVYLVSALASQSESSEIGCLGFVRKPVNMKALLLIVQEHCEQKTKQR